jgi:RNA polymerase sigma-70 factor (ECF subfamily)
MAAGAYRRPLARLQRRRELCPRDPPAGREDDVTPVTLSDAAATPEVGVTETFDQAFPTLWRASYRVAFRLLGDREDAADIAQESCARACVRWSRLSANGDVTPWVVRVSSNLALDRWRRDRRRRLNSAPLASPAPMHDERVDLHRALARLPRRQREVVVLRYVGDLREADVATALGMSAGTVKTHAARGLAALRVLVPDEGRR